MKFTVRELAEELGISRQAVFNQIKRNPDLEGHIEKQGNKFYIDEIGQDIIRERSIGRPQSMLTDQSLLSELEALRKENSELKDVIIKLQADKFESVKLIAEAETNKKLLEETQINVRRIMNEKEVLQEENRSLSNGINEHVQELNRANEELERQKNAYDILKSQLDIAEFNLEIEKNKSWWDKLRGK